MSDRSSAQGSEELSARAKQLGKVWWLVDAPMFIDRPLVEGLHDAIVWPELKEQFQKKAKFSEIILAFGGKAGAEAGVDASLPGFLSWISPKLEAKATLEGTFDRKATDQKNEVVQGFRIESSERKLNELVLEYLSAFPERVLFVDVPGGRYSNFRGDASQAHVDKLLEQPPRPLVFMDIAPCSPIYPTMAEMQGGGFRPIFLKLDEKLFTGMNPIPKYPADESEEGRKKYWGAVKANFSSRVAMQQIEAACEEGRIGWIDFRLLFSHDSETSHLHIVPGGAYHAGIFGYNFVHRGYKYGCRIVGSLKSGNDVNVMAIYER